MSGGQDSIPQNAHLTNSPRKTAAGSTFIVSPDAKNSPRKTAAGSTFIVSPDAKIRPNHARWVGFDTANCPPDAFIQENSGR